MPHSFGHRARTRDLFARKYGEHGYTRLSTYLQTYKVGDYVDIVVNSSQHKGLPYRFYHGKTGVVFNVGKRAIGVRINKQINNRIIVKHVHVRIEHVKPSKCRAEFLKRVKINSQALRTARKNNIKIAKGQLKRKPVQPKVGYTLANAPTPVTIQPVPFVDLV